MASGYNYSDPRFGTRQVFPLNESGSLAGTSASASEIGRYTLFEDAQILDWNLRIKTGGTAAVQSVLIGYSLGGTGAFTAIGTQALGTCADSTVLDASLTETALSAGDDIVVQKAAATSAAVYNVQPIVSFRERFVQA